MAKDYDIYKLRDDKVLGRAEDSLRKLAIDGELASPVSNEILKKYQNKLSPEVGERMWKRIRARSAIADRFRRCPGRSQADGLSFPDLLRALRTKAGVSIDEAAKAIRLKPGDVSALEEGRKDPFKVSADVVANLMEVYWLPIALVAQSLRQVLAAQAVRHEFSGVSARSSEGIAEEDYERAFRDIASHVAKGRGADEKVELPADFLKALRRALQQRGRSDLL
jgi:transcriptional regulator with XRE-family HTH domain